MKGVVLASRVLLALALAPPPPASSAMAIVGAAERFAPGIASTGYDEIRLTLSPDGRTALWFSRNRPGGPGGYDIWMSRLQGDHWSPATPVPFNTPGRDFDPAFSADGHFVFFCSDRPGGLGGDDLYRVAVDRSGRFGPVENLGPAVNSRADEFAPMLSPDGGTLLFSSDRRGGKGGHDLYAAAMRAGRLQPAQALAGSINTPAQEFDATFLADGRTVVFARARDFATAPVRLYVAGGHDGRYGAGTRLASPLNEAGGDSYGAMLDGSRHDVLTYSARRTGGSMDLYRVRYRLHGR